MNDYSTESVFDEHGNTRTFTGTLIACHRRWIYWKTDDDRLVIEKDGQLEAIVTGDAISQAIVHFVRGGLGEVASGVADAFGIHVEIPL